MSVKVVVARRHAATAAPIMSLTPDFTDGHRWSVDESSLVPKLQLVNEGENHTGGRKLANHHAFRADRTASFVLYVIRAIDGS